MVDTKELDRLVSKTELSPISKQALREVRKAVVSGRATDPKVGDVDWEVGIVTRGGSSMVFRFSMKKVK